MPNSCYVPNCRSGYASENKRGKDNNLKPPSLFKAPSDPELLRKWQVAIPRSDKKLCSSHWVCEKHFSESCIERYFRTMLQNNEEHLIQRERPRLLHDAVPTKFPDCPKYLSKRSPNKRKAPTDRTANIKIRKKLTNSTDDEPETLSSKLPPVLHKEPEEAPAVDEHSVLISFTALQLEDFNKDSWSRVILSDGNVIRYINWPSDSYMPVKFIDIDRNLLVSLIFGNVRTAFVGFEALKSLDQFTQLFDVVEKTNICPGSLLNKFQNCRGYLSGDDLYCVKCKLSTATATKLKQSYVKKGRRINQNMKKKITRLKKQVSTLQQRLNRMQDECAKIHGSTVIEEIQNLSIDEHLKENILACINTAAARHPNGRRYTQKWMYECILLKIKSKKAYEHIRRHKLMPLPCPATISRYIRGLKPAYGFQTAVFDLLKKQSDKISNMEKEGCLLIDEMSVRETYHFDKNKMKILGFTDLGEHTPELQKTQLGNHALVIMYQPYAGSWIQPIGSFLSRGAASSTVLYLLILEAIILIENSGFRVNNVTTDGAQWNRSMWSKFGITEDETSCEHIMDPDRKLWFVSDFPHLIKNLRNWMTDKHHVFHTPDGTVKLQHWEELLKVNRCDFTLRCAHKLTEAHLRPKTFQKMSVSLAYQLFDYTNAHAMEVYKENEKHEKALEGCESTCKFIRRIKKLITAMSSRCSKGALRISADCTERKSIENFLVYLNDWEKLHENSKAAFLTANTKHGLKVTLTSTLQIADYLTRERGYSYFMVSRLNQDNLERFFGMIRSGGGCDDHPDSVKFTYIYRLMSAYSLLKTAKGSNVLSAEVFETFCHNKIIRSEISLSSNLETDAGKNVTQDELISKLDSVVAEGDVDFDIFTEEENFVLKYVAGYIVRRSAAFSLCDQCMASIRREKSNDDSLIAKRDKFHVLFTPADELMSLLTHLERIILTEVQANDVKPDTFIAVSTKIDEDISLLSTAVGCIEHAEQVTMKIKQFYLIMRMNIICTIARKRLESSTRCKKFKKDAKFLV